MKCEICGKETDLFTETYNPDTGKHRSIFLCHDHHTCLLGSMDQALDDMKEFQRQNKVSLEYKHQWSERDCCMNCIHVHGEPDNLYCNVVGSSVHKNDSCRVFLNPHASEDTDESVRQRKMHYNYRHYWQGNDCCMNCMHISQGPDGLTCNVIGGRVYKGDTCSAFKRRGYVINEGTPDERILERDTEFVANAIKEAMDSKPIPILTPTGECLKEIGEVLSWMYCRGTHMFGTDEEIEAAIRRIGGEEE